MNKREYLSAIKQAKRVFGYVAITNSARRAAHITKKDARALVSRLDESADIDAMWASDEQQILLVG